MEVGHQFGQVGLLEVLGADPRVEAPHPEEDGVGAVLDGGLHAIPLPGGRQDLGFAESAATGNDGHASIKGPPPREGSGKFVGRPKPGARFLCCPGLRGAFDGSMADKLEEIFRMQEALNKRIGVETAGMSEEEKVKWTLNYLRAMQQEMAELTDSVPWKWWAKYQKFDEQNARVEVIDLFHFLISIAQVLGMSAEDVYQAYLKKNAVNHQRQDSGYVQKDENDSRHI